MFVSNAEAREIRAIPAADRTEAQAERLAMWDTVTDFLGPDVHSERED